MFYKVLLAVLGLCVAFNMKCPETAQWSNRARLHCPDPSLYYCLLSIDGNSRINVENCSRVDFEAPGKRIVIRWNIDAFYCTNDKYQPIKYWTNVSTDCIFLTSTCSEEGQVLNSVDRYHEYDTSCRCDYSKGYDFVTRPNNPSLCIPSEEDCSCYKKRCAIINSTLSRDQKDVVDISTVFPITSVATYKDIFLELPEINNTDNIGKGNYWNTPAAIVVSVIIIISTCICVVLLCCENQIEGIDQFGGKENPKTTLDENDKRSYLNNIKLLTETRYLIRIIIIGENGVGKTCLLRRLLKREILGVDSTDGIDIHSCKIQKDDGKWIIDKEIDKKKELIVRLKRCMQNAQKPKDDSTIDKGNDQTLEETPSSSTQFEMGNAKNEHKSAVERTLDNSTLEPEINKFKDVNLEKKSNTSHSVLTTSTQPNKAEKQQVHENQISNILNNTILQDISGFLDEMENSKISDEVLVDCRFWDFAGEPEYYPTHPIFINPRALHLLVAKMTNEKDYEQQIKVDKGFKHIGEYLDFWFDSVHSLTYFQTKAENTQDKLDPPVILVGTNIDKFGDSEDLAERTETFRRKVIKLVGEEKQKHLRGIYAVSNTKSNEKTIDGLRKLIFEVGKKMKTFGEMLPLKFIRLERALDIVREADVNILSWSDITKLGYTCSFDNEYEINKFLIYQHEIGNIIYFEKLNETIILNQQWLADAFRCLVSAKYDNDVTITPEWIALENTGKLADVLVTKLLKKKSQFIRSEHRNHILKVMEMFGIIFKITTLTSNGGTETSPTYYMPCMIRESTSIEKIKEQFCVYEIQKCTQSPWLCIEFEFMPLDIFNNIMREFISTYYVCTEPKNQRMAIYYGLGVFLPWGSEFQKLVVYFCKNTIALQIWQWEEKIENKKYKEIVDLMQLWIDRYQTKYEKRKLIYTLKTKCSDEDIHSVGGRKSFEDLERCEKYMCTHEQNIEYHRSSDFLQTWFYRFKETPFDAGVHQHDQCPSKEVLSSPPSEQHLARLAIYLNIEKLREYVIHLGLTDDALKKIEHKHSGSDIQVFKITFDALCEWKKSVESRDLGDPSFEMLNDALKRTDEGRHLLCRIFREETKIFELEHKALQKILDDDSLLELSKQIGNCALHLGVELGLTTVQIEETIYRHGKDMFKQNYDILTKWSKSEGNTTLRRLMQALQIVDPRGLTFLRKKYIN